MSNLTFTPDIELVGKFGDSKEFVRALLGNMVLLSSQIDQDNSGKASKAELLALLEKYQINRKDHCKMFGDQEHAERFDKLLGDIKTAINTNDSNALADITASIEQTTNEQLPLLFRWAGPNPGDYRAHVEAALKDPAIIEASRDMVIAHDNDLLDVCRTLPQKTRFPTREK